MGASIGQTLWAIPQAKGMPKRAIRETEQFGARLVKLLADAGVPRRGAGGYLAKRYKVSNVTANDWLNGKFKPATDTAMRIAEDHGITFEALYFGVSARSAKPARYRITEAVEGEALPIQLVEARGSCGGGSVAWDDDSMEPLLKEPRWFKRFKIKPEDALAVWADGDSMADFIIDGDIVIFDKSKRTPRSGHIYLIDHPDGLRIKRLRRDIDGSWVLESNNTDKRRYPDERIEPEQGALLKIRGEFVYRQGG